MRRLTIVKVNNMNFTVYNPYRPVARFFNEEDAKEYLRLKTVYDGVMTIRDPYELNEKDDD